MYLFLYFHKLFISIFWRTTLETSVLLCNLMCLSSVNIIYMLISLFAFASNVIICMYYNVLTNKLTINSHSQSKLINRTFKYFLYQ